MAGPPIDVSAAAPILPRCLAGFLPHGVSTADGHVATADLLNPAAQVATDLRVGAREALVEVLTPVLRAGLLPTEPLDLRDRKGVADRSRSAPKPVQAALQKAGLADAQRALPAVSVQSLSEYAGGSAATLLDALLVVEGWRTPVRGRPVVTTQQREDADLLQRLDLCSDLDSLEVGDIRFSPLWPDALRVEQLARKVAVRVREGRLDDKVLYEEGVRFLREVGRALDLAPESELGELVDAVAVSAFRGGNIGVASMVLSDRFGLSGFSPMTPREIEAARGLPWHIVNDIIKRFTWSVTTGKAWLPVIRRAAGQQEGSPLSPGVSVFAQSVLGLGGRLTGKQQPANRRQIARMGEPTRLRLLQRILKMLAVMDGPLPIDLAVRLFGKADAVNVPQGVPAEPRFDEPRQGLIDLCLSGEGIGLSRSGLEFIATKPVVPAEVLSPTEVSILAALQSLGGSGRLSEICEAAGTGVVEVGAIGSALRASVVFIAIDKRHYRIDALPSSYLESLVSA